MKPSADEIASADNMKCGLCFYFESLDGAKGQCHRLPPQINPSLSSSTLGIWPGVEFAGWCGEFKLGGTPFKDESAAEPYTEE
jgi:hypothetical protein